MDIGELLEHMRELPAIKAVIPTATTSFFMESKILSIAPASFEIELLPQQSVLKGQEFVGDCILSCEKGGQVVFLHAKIDLIHSETRLRLIPKRVSEQPQKREFFRIDAVVYLKFWLVEKEDSGAPRVAHQQINLSGNGLRFTTENPLHVGQAVGLELHLPAAEGDLVVKGVGRVVRVATKDWHEQEAALELVELEESEQDKIIRFCLAEQRRQLRMKVHVI